MAKPFIVERAGPLSIATLLIGLIMTIIGLMAIFSIGFKDVGNWDYWLVMLGLILTIVGIIWTSIYFFNIKKFNALFEEKSKAAFVKKRDDIEFLAWKLPSKFETRLLEKEKGFGLK